MAWEVRELGRLVEVGRQTGSSVRVRYGKRVGSLTSQQILCKEEDL